MFCRRFFSQVVHTIRIRPLPYFLDSKKLLSSVENAGIECIHAFKRPKDKSAEISFNSAESRDRAISILKSNDVFGKEISVEIVENTLSMEDLQEKESKRHAKAKSKMLQRLEKQQKSIPDSKSVVSPWWNISYEEQLKRKQEMGRVALKKIYKNLVITYGKEIVKKSLPFAQDRFVCSLEDIIYDGDSLKGYRNKNNFTISKDESGNITIGFRVGSYSDYGFLVGDLNGCDYTVPSFVIDLCVKIQEFIRSSGLDSCNPLSDSVSGFWRSLLIRHSASTNQVMVGIQVNSNGVNSSDELKSIQRSFVDFVLSSKLENPFNIHTVVWQNYNGSSTAPSDLEYEILYGDGYILDSLQNLQFRVQPNSFFQVNSKMAEKLYSTVGEWISFDKKENVSKKILLDICCGTGTIGLSLSKYVDQVYGLELNPDAIQDAKFNANMNNITNAEFIQGRAEQTLPELMQRLKDEHDNNREIIAIVDPPREGLHRYVIRAIRECPLISQLIYVSCNPKTMTANVESLMRHECGKRKGIPFQAVKAVMLDMFPHTEHCEMIVQLERCPNSESAIYSPFAPNQDENHEE